jgi:outer membrane protein assembly factor BamB
MSWNKGIAALILLSAVIAVLAVWNQFSAAPVARTILDDGGTAWKPKGNPTVAASNQYLSTPITFRTMHVGLNNTDHLWTATAPEQELAWVAEQDMYIPEGPTMDNEGRIYFSPLHPREDVSLVVLDGDTGKRLWTLPHYGDSRGAGAPLILDTPQYEHGQTIYHATYHWAWAVTPQGKVLWHKPTGLTYDGDDSPHAWGVNYIPQVDALTVVTENGEIVILARKTGEQLLATPFELPGLTTGDTVQGMPPNWILRRGDEIARQRFGEMPTNNGNGLLTSMLRVVFGAGSEVSNFYSVDVNTGRMFVAATAPDEADGSKDGLSDNGAVYALDLASIGDQLLLNISARYDFNGGTGSTPSATNDGQRIYVTDSNGNVIALDRDLQEIWRINVGSQVAASVAVSADNAELYLVTRADILKLWDRGDHAERAWTAQLDVFPDHINVNTLTPTITANGIAVAIGASRELGDTSLLMENGFGLLDRETGKVRGYVQGVEEGIAATVVAADGGFTIAHTPVRRLASKAIFGDSISPITGGIARYKPSNYARLAREASCAAAAIQARSKAQQGMEGYDHMEQQWDDNQVQALMTQVENALEHTNVFSIVDSPDYCRRSTR